MDWAGLQQKINNYTTVISSWVRNMGKMYFSNTPENVTVDMIDDNGNLTTATLPNVALFRKRVWDDVGGALGQMSRSFYVDAINGDDSNIGDYNHPFRTLKRAIDSLPICGKGNIQINAGSSTELIINENIDLKGKKIYLRKYGSSDNLNIRFAYDYSGSYAIRKQIIGEGIIYFYLGVNIVNDPIDPNYDGAFYDTHLACIVPQKGLMSVVALGNIINNSGNDNIPIFYSSPALGGILAFSKYYGSIETNNNYIISLYMNAILIINRGAFSLDNGDFLVRGGVQDSNGNYKNILGAI